jgi:hypothetical protein
MAKKSPSKVTLCAYPVGFGDCFLLTFQYASGLKHVLIDFGSTGTPKGSPKNLLHVIANDIQARCGKKLHVVIATHRHKDHISGFATSKKGKGPGDIIAECKPDVVIQPWTEDPKAQPDAKVPTGSRALRGFVASLSNMHQVANGIRAEARRLHQSRGQGLRVGRGVLGELDFLGDDNIANRSAVENLMRMGKRHIYASYGAKLPLVNLLPGVKVHVLGPPTLKQTEKIAKQRHRDPEEFWHLLGLSAERFQTQGIKMFPAATAFSGPVPAYARWFRKKLLGLRGQQLLQIVRILDDAMNNTSLILLFEIGGYRLLFPGDAQIENWSYALKDAKDSGAVRKELQRVNVYKVGHHGSLNATPKTLWQLFKNKSKAESKGRLQTVNSTMPGKHGTGTKGTEVPRGLLVTEMSNVSDYYSTQHLAPSRAAPQVLEIELPSGKVMATPKKKNPK